MKINKLSRALLFSSMLFITSIGSINSVNNSILADEVPTTDVNDSDNDNTPYDPNDVFVTRDDFTNETDYKTYLRLNPDAPTDANIELPTTAAVASEKLVDPTLRYTFEGLKHGQVVQKSYVDEANGYVYAVQNLGGGTTSWISRCSIQGDKAVYIDEMELINYGHTEALDMFQHNGENYFWIGCKAESLPINRQGLSAAATFDWATQIGRLKYSPGSSINYKEMPRISAISSANKNGTPAGKIKRAEAALTSDQSKVMFLGQMTNGTIQLSQYDAVALNNKLDTVENASVKNIAASELTGNCLAAHTLTKTQWASMLPYQSLQGLELNDASKIYLSSGHTGYDPKLSKMGWKSTTPSEVFTVTLRHQYEWDQIETEGIQLHGDYVYTNLSSHHNDGRPTEQYIYTVPKAEFK